MKSQSVTITPQSIVFTVVFLLMLALIFVIKDIILTIFLAMIIMSALNPLVERIEKYQVPRAVAILFVYTVLISVVGILFAFIVPPLSWEFTNLLKTLDLPVIPEEIRNIKLDIQALGSVFNQIGSSINSVIDVISSTFSGIFFIFTLMVLAFYLLLERASLPQKLTWFSSSKKTRELAKEFLDRLEKELGSWVRGQLLLMLTIGFCTFISLTVLGIPYAVPLAVLAGTLEILPNLGPTIAAIPAIIVALLLVSPQMAAIVTVLYILIQQLENNLIVPKIMKAAVNVDPLTSIISILIGVRLGGVMGALLAIPTFIVFRIIFDMYSREKLR